MNAPHEPDVFVKMGKFQLRLDGAEDEASWAFERLRAVLETIQDARVTYSIIGDNGETITPMMVERDAIVDALYGGGESE